jgi:hypothetical protein
MATSETVVKNKLLSMSKKLCIINKVGGIPNVPHNKTAEKLGIPVR